MLTKDFTYHLPSHLIAQSPASPRDSSALMLINRATQEISHHHVYDLPHLLPRDYFIVANNTKVFPARLLGHKPTGGKVEILLTKPLGHSIYRCIARPGLRIGDTIIFPTPVPSRTDLVGTITSISGIERTISFNQEESLLRTTLSSIGSIPTPPYIKQFLGDAQAYQTIYAKYGFSAAAPTAGLHFTQELLGQMKTNFPWHELTLNVGLGTFLPVKAESIEDHHMHQESYNISHSSATAINALKKQGLSRPSADSVPCKKLLAIGTTTMRALESNATYNPRGYKSLISPGVTPGFFSTDIFIYPPYRFQITDALMTNFHLPESTLLMLVSAFCSYPNTKEKFTNFQDSILGRAYAKAIAHNYRFFSFGDAMLII